MITLSWRRGISWSGMSVSSMLATPWRGDKLITRCLRVVLSERLWEWVMPRVVLADLPGRAILGAGLGQL